MVSRTGTEARSGRSSVEPTITLNTQRFCLDKTLAHLLHDWVADVVEGHLNGHHDFKPLLRPGRTGSTENMYENGFDTYSQDTLLEHREINRPLLPGKLASILDWSSLPGPATLVADEYRSQLAIHPSKYKHAQGVVSRVSKARPPSWAI